MLAQDVNSAAAAADRGGLAEEATKSLEGERRQLEAAVQEVRGSAVRTVQRC